MFIGGQIVSLVGGGISAYEGIIAEQAAIEAAKESLVASGAVGVTLQQTLQQVADDMLLKTMLEAGAKVALSTYSTITSIIASLAKQEMLEIISPITPAEKINEIYVADDMSWDYVQQYMPEFIIASTMKIM